MGDETLDGEIDKAEGELIALENQGAMALFGADDAAVSKADRRIDEQRTLVSRLRELRLRRSTMEQIAGDDPEAARRAIVRLVPAEQLRAVVVQLLAELMAQQPPSMVLGPEHPALKRAMTEAGEALQRAGRLTELPQRCTGVTATWCPVCGDCSCPQAPEPPLPPADPRCPLHGEGSSHGELEADHG
jgi:hypothetical protein